MIFYREFLLLLRELTPVITFQALSCRGRSDRWIRRDVARRWRTVRIAREFYAWVPERPASLTRIVKGAFSDKPKRADSIDAQLRPALAPRVESLAHRAEHGFDLDLAQAPDDHIRATAAEWGAVIVTNDFAASCS